MRHRPVCRPLRRRATAVLGASTVVALAACGSQIPPSQFFTGQGAREVGAQGVDAVRTAAAGPGDAGTLVPNRGAPSGSTAPGSISRGAVRGSGGERNGGEAPAAGNGRAPASDRGGAKTSSAPAPGTSVKAGSCAGFKNTTGITDSQLTIANVADISGPVPNLFKSAQSAVQAYVAYFNSASDICGRKLRLMSLDSGTSENIDQQADTTACGSAFAEVGSLGAFDAGGASVAATCGIPDLRAFSTEPERFKSPVSFGAYSLAINLVPAAPFNYFKTLGNAYKSAAFVYLNAGAAIVNAKSYMAAQQKLGFDYKDQVPIDVTSVPNYGAIVQRLKGDGIKYVQYMGAYQYAVSLKSAMYQQNYNPVFVMDPTGYDADYVAAGKPVDGTYSFVPAPLFEEAGKNPQLQTYLTWLKRTSGGTPTFFGVYAWAAADLFTQLAVQLGGKLTRASLLQAVRGVHDFTDHGLVPPQNPGIKQTGKCLSVVQLVNGKWVRKTPYPYTCGSLIDSGVGG